MATGNITQQIALLGKMVADNAPHDVDAVRKEMVFAIAQQDPFMTVQVAKSRVSSQIGYLAGYLPVEVGNAVLQMFHVEHPVFGRVLPDDLDTAFEAGKRLGKEWLKKRQADAEMKKKIDSAAKLGVALPDGDETVSSKSATEVLHAIRKRRAASGDALSAEELAKSEEIRLRAKMKASLDEDEDSELLGDPFEEEDEDEDSI